MSVQVIQRNGKPEWAVIPYADYLQLVEQAEMLQDSLDYDQAKAAVESGEDEIIPAEVVYAILDGKSPVLAWREVRGLTQRQVAEKAGISVPYLSQLEAGKRTASVKVLAALARVLQVTLDDLAR